jgi:hypothetical protein
MNYFQLPLGFKLPIKNLLFISFYDELLVAY